MIAQLTARPSSWSTVGHRYRWCAAAVVVAALADLAFVVHRLSSRFVNEDQASVLAAAAELLRLRLQQPSFPGQHYGTFAEGLVAAALLPLGVPPVLALTWTLGLLWYGAWLAVAAAAYRAGARATALLAAGMPLLLAVYPVFYASTFATGAGRLLAVVGAALLWRGPARYLPMAVGTAALALVADPSAVVTLAAGVVLGSASVVDVVRRRPAAVVLWCLPAFTWWGGRRVFAAARPDHGLHAAPPVDPSLATTGQVVARAADYSDISALALLPTRPLALVVGVVAVAACLLVGSLRLRVAAFAVLLVVAAIGSTSRALDDVSDFLPGGRVFMAVPYAVVLLLAALEAQLPQLPQLPRRALVAAAAVLLLVSAVAGVVRAPDQAAAVEAAAPTAPVVPVVPVSAFTSGCRDADELARAEGVELVVYVDDRLAAYGCPLVAEYDHETLLPAYERRTWRLYDEQVHRHQRIAVVGQLSCDRAGGLVCRPAASGFPGVVVEAGDLPALEVVRRLGLPVRPFGPGCSPPRPETCG